MSSITKDYIQELVSEIKSEIGRKGDNRSFSLESVNPEIWGDEMEAVRNNVLQEVVDELEEQLKGGVDILSGEALNDGALERLDANIITDYEHEATLDDNMEALREHTEDYFEGLYQKLSYKESAKEMDLRKNNAPEAPYFAGYEDDMTPIKSLLNEIDEFEPEKLEDDVLVGDRKDLFVSALRSEIEFSRLWDRSQYDNLSEKGFGADLKSSARDILLEVADFVGSFEEVNFEEVKILIYARVPNIEDLDDFAKVVFGVAGIPFDEMLGLDEEDIEVRKFIESQPNVTGEDVLADNELLESGEEGGRRIKGFGLGDFEI